MAYDVTTTINTLDSIGYVLCAWGVGCTDCSGCTGGMECSGRGSMPYVGVAEGYMGHRGYADCADCANCMVCKGLRE